MCATSNATKRESAPVHVLPTTAGMDPPHNWIFHKCENNSTMTLTNEISEIQNITHYSKQLGARLIFIHGHIFIGLQIICAHVVHCPIHGDPCTTEHYLMNVCEHSFFGNWSAAENNCVVDESMNPTEVHSTSITLQLQLSIRACLWVGARRHWCHQHASADRQEGASAEELAMWVEWPRHWINTANRERRVHCKKTVVGSIQIGYTIHISEWFSEHIWCSYEEGLA